MGLFTNPVTLTDGTDNRIFAQRSTLQGLKPGMFGGDYIETAAEIAAKSLLTVKTDMRTAIIRNLLQRTHKVHPAADTETDDLYAITWNITCVAHELFSAAELQLEYNILADAMQEANVIKSLRSGQS
jgi:hypothetical protein